MVSQNEKMKKVVMSMFRTMPALINVLMITILFYIIFGILGVMFFRGIMYSCNDPTILLERDCIGSFIDSKGNQFNRN